MKITAAELKRLAEMDPEKRHYYFSNHQQEINFDHLVQRCKNHQPVKVGRKPYFTNDNLEDIIESVITFFWIKKHAEPLLAA